MINFFKEKWTQLKIKTRLIRKEFALLRLEFRKAIFLDATIQSIKESLIEHKLTFIIAKRAYYRRKEKEKNPDSWPNSFKYKKVPKWGIFRFLIMLEEAYAFRAAKQNRIILENMAKKHNLDLEKIIKLLDSKIEIILTPEEKEIEKKREAAELLEKKKKIEKKKKEKEEKLKAIKEKKKKEKLKANRLRFKLINQANKKKPIEKTKPTL